MIKSMMMFFVLFMFTTGGLLSCVNAWDKEQTAIENKNSQWVQDSKDNKTYTNFGE